MSYEHLLQRDGQDGRMLSGHEPLYNDALDEIELARRIWHRALDVLEERNAENKRKSPSNSESQTSQTDQVQANERLNDVRRGLLDARPLSSHAASPPDRPCIKRPNPSWETTTFTLRNDAFAKYIDGTKLFAMDASYLSCFRVQTPRDKLLLYCRRAFHDQVAFLTTQIERDGHLGYIVGSPSTGKTLTTLAFASTLDTTKWTVTRICIHGDDAPHCVRLEDGAIRTRVLSSYIELREIFFDEMDDDAHHFVILDGVTHQHDEEQAILRRWRRRKTATRRLVIVASRATRYKTKIYEDKQDRLVEFKLHAWTLRECVEAVQENGFFDDICCHLDASYAHVDAKTELTESKFYFAGGNARYMFTMPTDAVINDLKQSIAAASGGQVDPILTESLDRLLIHSFSSDGAHHVDFLSAYAAAEVALSGNQALIQKLAGMLKPSVSSAADGWKAEWAFLSNLQFKGVVCLSDAKKTRIEYWSQAPLRRFDPTNAAHFDMLPTNAGVWLKPVKWSRGGYDAVFLDQRRHLVRFLSVVRSESHSFNLEFMERFLTKLVESSSAFEIAVVEIVALTDSKQLATRGPSDLEITGQGCLERFPGWTKGEEWKSIQVVAIE
ncbi:hypothetical protein LEN26_004212 [Aphanomyces euteiches]|nr:hypothetical protein AeMF1_000706 [Aphanomyces euteiches]KAH9149568.1 hypothetical protein LEN26_004212 [Aphanomyces euteiches]KAH9195558.1 hypothetical protein AeNC1_002475 [Aphanomyces euteiches]